VIQRGYGRRLHRCGGRYAKRRDQPTQRSDNPLPLQHDCRRVWPSVPAGRRRPGEESL